MEGHDRGHRRRPGHRVVRRARPDGVKPPLTFDLIAGGHSNLTFGVRDEADGHWVLRRPPLGQVLATAHDMGREHTIISALGPTDVPGAARRRPLHRRGGERRAVLRHGLRRRPRRPRRQGRAAARRPSSARRAGESIVDTLAAIHAVDLDAVGLGDARPQGGLHRPPAQALVRAVGEARRPATCPPSTRCTTGCRRPSPSRARPRSSTATTGSTTAWSAPTATSSRCSTGRSARSATRWPTSAC